MSAINDLISQIENSELRERIQREVDKMAKQKKFGLVFEEHLPECSLLYDVPVRKGSKVAQKNGKVNDFYTVLSIEGDRAVCMKQREKTAVELPLADIVTVAEFGEPIYPYLKPLDAVCNAPDSELWHTLIEADNYHALQLLEYLYAGKVDCIYIDPPYNTGARDWKYNNNYVDSNDTYRHSKWLSMMQKRLKIAKKLLKRDGMLITTIDDNEYADLYLLIEELFPECSNTTISIQMNPGGTQGKAFSVTNEYAIITYFSSTQICKKKHIDGDTYNLRRWGSTSNRYEGATCFYPIILNSKDEIMGFGNVLSNEIHPSAQVEYRQDGTKLVWPIDVKGIEKKWRYARDTVESVKSRMFVEKHNERIEIFLHRETEPPKTIWINPEYNSEAHGTKLIKDILGKGRFSYPKSLYATKDCISLMVANKPNALIVDFFAGSGTTLHAVNLLNAEDGGHRRCIVVTNNEVSDAEAKNLAAKGYRPGDEEWEKQGIARYVTWPRTVCSIEGHDVDGRPLKGNYLGSNLPMADGFKANATYFKLGFLDKNAVALGRQFKEMLPTLWMKAGAYGKCPTVEGEMIPKMLFLPENRFAVLNEENAFLELEVALKEHPEIETVYIITDYQAGYSAMAKKLNVKHTYQLYRDYLDNFRINTGRN